MAKVKDERGKRRAKSPSKFSQKLIISAVMLILITVMTVIANIYLLQESPEAESQSGDRLVYDLELATLPFGGKSFPLDHVIGEQPVWGTLNSGHYFSMKLSTPSSLETSFIWFKNQLNNEGRLNMRHLCDQNDRLDFYAWVKHDFHTFGEQIIEDGDHKFRITFLKNDSRDLEWKAKVELESTNLVQKPLSVIQYITIDNPEDRIKLRSHQNHHQSSTSGEPFVVEGSSVHIGDFKMKIDFTAQRANLIHDFILSDFVDKNRYPISSYLHSRMLVSKVNNTRIFILPGHAKSQESSNQEPNIVAYQMILKPPASFVITFSRTRPSDASDNVEQSYELTLEEKIKRFEQKFRDTFPLDKMNLTGNMTYRSLDKLAKVSLSNLIGSVGYFYGYSIIGTELDTRVARYGPIQLLTGVPSRSFFPRGFLWDEAFHSLLINAWDEELSNKILKSWFNIMNVNGWIPREVILGVESMRRVPPEFIIQRISNANPPAMFIVLEKMLENGSLQQSTLETIYPRLKTWYKWFNVTQSGMKSGTFRWRGRDELSINMLNPKTLTSGLDDYPRASHPSPEEYHIDLLCWMALAARTLTKLASKQGDSEFKEVISLEAEKLSDNTLLDKLYWSDQHQMYCDFGHNTEDIELVRVTKTRRVSQDSDRLETYHVLERHSTGHPKFGCVPEFGYVSLFPMLLRILDHRSDKLGIILDKLTDPQQLWSDYGVRSLSKLSKYYNKYNTEHDKPYWRGPVWLNINYLILSSLEYYSKLNGPHQTKCREIYQNLKQNLVQNVDKEFQRTNYIWENYQDHSGFGQGSHPFTGWSALILLIMSSD